VVDHPDPELLESLRRILPSERILSRPIDRLGRSADASIYRLIPQVVVRPKDVEEIRGLLAFAVAAGRHLTFRAAGTSLSGQAVTDDILVELAPFWTRAEILDGGARVRAEPGVVGARVNRLLAPHRRGLGPDPASIEAAMIGGIVANNSSGMCCGIARNSYATLDALRLVLADGTLIDTSQADADAALKRHRPELHQALERLRDDVRSQPELVARIRKKFRVKNTSGYSLNALLDFDAPAEILAHLIVGSEGTLGFVAEATFRTIPEPPARATALLVFAELLEAGAAVAPLAALNAAAVEIMDAVSLRSQQGERSFPFEIGDRAAALLVEFREDEETELARVVDQAQQTLAPFSLLASARFTTDAAEREQHWRLRKGLFPSVGALRPPGTAVLIEDVAVPVERLAEAIGDLQALFERHGVPETIIFGHAKDGNLHFVLAEDFADQKAVERYDRIMHELVELVVQKYDGSLKAEHGSGRNMAPFIRSEWGGPAYEVMRRVKALLDPHAVLNPGVLLNEDPLIHLKNLKPLPAISPLADRCIECGFCEPRCPTKHFTLTPRERIVVERERTRLGTLAGAEARNLRRGLAADFEHQGLASCVGDSMCQLACPVGIDTGALVKQLRAAARPAWQRTLAAAAATHFAATASLCRGGLATAAFLRSLPGGSHALGAATALLHRLAPGLVPHVSPTLTLPRAAPALPRLRRGGGGPRVVYFPSCLTRVVGPQPDETALPLAEATLDVLDAAGFDVRVPPGLHGLCCGMPFSSKAFPEAAERAAQATLEALWHESREGRDPVVLDSSPCAGTLLDAVERQAESRRTLRVLDFPAFWAREALPRLEPVQKRPGVAVLHPTCTLLTKGGLPDLLKVARAHSERVVVPVAAECCGFAGDRGFLTPELTAHATAVEAAEVAPLAAAGAGLYSTCRTCEIGMSRAVGRPYRSIVHLVHEAQLSA